jgi:signal transduction histidine kinase
MNLDSIRWRLTAGYIGIFAVLLSLLGVFAVFGFSRELVFQQDELLEQEARHQAKNVLGGEQREVLAEGSDEFGWVVLGSGGRVIDRDAAAPSLGLPRPDLAREALEEEDAIFTTIRGEDGNVRAVSMPIYESGEVSGVIQYARSLQVIKETVRGLILVLLPLVVGALGLAAVGGLYMARRAVRPIRETFGRQRAFIADASHELKTPLTLIRVDTEVLRGKLQGQDEMELAEEVLAEADRMGTILTDLLTMARLDAGALDVARKPFDLSVLIEEETERFRVRAVHEGVRLEVRVPEELLATGDPAKTGQILAALLDNALRYTPSGGSIEVNARRQDGMIEATVADTGPGILPEHLPRVFDRFYRAESARTRKGGGTGIGLAIARGLAHAQDGELDAVTAGDGGAMFRLKLPAD